METMAMQVGLEAGLDVALGAALRVGLPAEEVARRAAAAQRGGDLSRRAVAFYLAEMQERGLHQGLGFPSAAVFAAVRLGMARRTAREMVRVGSALRELPGIEAAFEGGGLSWSKVRVLCRVVVAENEGAWLRAAHGATQEELERMVRGRELGDGPPEDGLPAATFRVLLNFDAAGMEQWRNACNKLRDEMGGRHEIGDVELALEMIRMVLESEPDGSAPGRRAVDARNYRVVVGEEGVGTLDGPEPIEAGRVEELTEGSRVPEKLRRKVLARDGHGCVHCGSQRRLHAHHVQWYSRGGATELDNLVTVCATCHGLIHENFIGVRAAQCAGGRGAGGTGAAGPRFLFTDSRGKPLHRRLGVSATSPP